MHFALYSFSSCTLFLSHSALLKCLLWNSSLLLFVYMPRLLSVSSPSQSLSLSLVSELCDHYFFSVFHPAFCRNPRSPASVVAAIPLNLTTHCLNLTFSPSPILTTRSRNPLIPSPLPSPPHTFFPSLPRLSSPLPHLTPSVP